MIYTWDINQWLQQYLNPLQVKQRLVALLRSYIRPIGDIHADFVDKISEINKATQYSSQQASLAALLNSEFDPDLRRITIITSNDLVPDVYIFNTDEDVEEVDEVFVYAEAEVIPDGDEIFIYSESEEGPTVDFIVNVPEAIESSVGAIEALVNYYRLAGKRFSITII